MKLRLILAAFVVAAVAACGTVPTATLNDKEAIALRATTAARQTATALLAAGKITLAQDRDAQAKADALVAGIKAARAAGDASKLETLTTDAQALKVSTEQKAVR